MLFILKIRVIVIWCAWRRNKYRDSILFWPIKLIAREKYAAIGFIVAGLLVTVIMADWGAVLRFGRPGLDWFDPAYLLRYRILNQTTVRIFEMYTSILSVYLISTFPSYLRIMHEYISFFCLNYFSFWLRESYRRFKYSSPIPNIIENQILCCRPDFIFEIVRSVAFSLIMCYFSQYNDPPPRVPSDLISSWFHFSNDVECLSYFKLYLQRKNQKALSEYEEAVHNTTLGWESSIEQRFEDSGNKLAIESAFQNFLSTKSFKTLKKLRQDEDNLAAIGLTSYKQSLRKDLSLKK